MAETAAETTVYASATARLGALVLDFALISFAIPVIAPAMPDPGPFGRLLPPLIFLLYFAGLPLTPLQGTPGKRLVGIRISGIDGGRAHWRAILVRAGAMLSWIALLVIIGGSHLPFLPGDGVRMATLLVMFLPWSAAAFLPRHQTLFDLLAGTLVVRYKASAASVSQEVPGKPRMLVALGMVLLCVLAGGVFSIFVFAMQDQDRRARVVYANQATAPLREKIEAFRVREGRWPSAAELGVTEYTPYPAGGGYRLRPDGSIVIGFSKLEELKGHEIIQRPFVPAGTKSVQWQCSPDPGMNMKYLPASCREPAR